DDVAALGEIELGIIGNTTSTQQAIGLYAAGDAFNAYVQSGSEVKLEALGNITIKDGSQTSNMILKGMEGEGATIANAYSTAPKDEINTNQSSIVKGNIDINVSTSKNGSIGRVYGIYNTKAVPMVAKIYNAALDNNTNTVEGKINITTPDRRDTYSKMYGIYVATYDANGGNSNDAQPKAVYNAYYNNNDATETGGSVLGEINIKAGGKSAATDAEYYGIYLDGGINGVMESEAHNAFSSNDAADVTGKIVVDVMGGTNSGTAAGMYGKNARIYNDGAKSSITVKASQFGTNAYGMLGDGAYLYNNTVINAENKNYIAYGMSVLNGSAVNDVNGIINVNGKTESYGIYVKADSETQTAQAINQGTINVSGEGNNYGIYASGANATVENKGTITINGQTCDGNDCNGGKAIWLDNGAKLVNSGVTESMSSLDFASMGGEVILDKGGKFIAKEKISGNLNISQETIKDTFETKTVLHEAITAQDIDDLNINSLSYLYDAKLVDNQNGSYDAEMSLKDLTAIMDKSQANYLTQNLQAKKNMELFNVLKTAQNAKEEQKIRASVMGTDMLPNITEEELKVQRSLDKTMLDELFKNPNEDIRKIVGGNLEYLGQDDRGTLTGYDLTSESMYALYDQKLDNNYRLGLGLSFTHTDTDYNNDSSRKNLMVQGYVPLTYTNNNGLTAVTMARLGYADGDYSRRGYNRTYKADTTEITYGLLNEVRYTMDLGLVNLTPFVGLNAIGWYMDSANEDGDDLALKLASNHVFSLESALGLYLDKEIEFSEVSKLSTVLGIGWYHEFADPYSGFDATHKASISSYKLRDKGNMNSRNRGILSAKVNYDYKDFSIYGELMQYLEDGHPLKVEGGLKYRF
ncbi:MAG: autotransporter domain-containing protein, partial [Alphaproteobacteria bacterium]|nr:autotransporter domain-containing protein [Alphaproteobacteria bacterium]